MKPKPQFAHPIIELLQQRWSPRAFTDKTLTDEQVLTLFEAARWAASCNNEQPWRFIWSLKDYSVKYSRLLDCLTPHNREWAAAAPLLICTLVSTVFASSGLHNKWARHDLGLAMGNLTAQATAMGLYVHSMAGFSAEKVVDSFALPADTEPVTMVVAGYLADSSQLSEFNRKKEDEPQTRKALTEFFL